MANVDGSISKYKARLVVKGYVHTYGIVYEETFSSAKRMATMRLAIARDGAKGWPLHQMDVKSSFLHDDLKEKVYMT